MGKAAQSTLISLTREIIFGVALPVVFPIFWGLNGILYSFPAADILTFVIALFIIRSTYKELNDDSSKMQIKEGAQRKTGSSPSAVNLAAAAER